MSNQISGALPSLANLTNLQEVYLNNNNFTSIPPSFLSGLNNLQTLSISENPNLAPRSIPEDLAQSGSLVMFYASKASIVGNGSLWSIDVLGTMMQLSQVWLHANGFSEQQVAGPFLDFLRGVQDFRLILACRTTSCRAIPRFPKRSSGLQVNLSTTNSLCNTKPGPCDSQVTALLEVAGALRYHLALAEYWVGNDPCQGWSFITCQGSNVTVINFGKQKFIEIESLAGSYQ
ncbi:hypothetical protein HHK36_017637 [Tetracentron sinense]|uniref:Uncharacterized protein n=1 Tax=Tetracentron sinense TaxID=13715 RepID=A0A834YYA0_TETSI|nr:hypothetical protein HHK36_017637 [Tetracentron sinense]